jgi:hypothetical protein
VVMQRLHPDDLTGLIGTLVGTLFILAPLGSSPGQSTRAALIYFDIVCR